jgi:hypothetical protein
MKRLATNATALLLLLSCSGAAAVDVGVGVPDGNKLLAFHR